MSPINIRLGSFTLLVIHRNINIQEAHCEIENMGAEYFTYEEVQVMGKKKCFL